MTFFNFFSQWVLIYRCFLLNLKQTRNLSPTKSLNLIQHYKRIFLISSGSVRPNACFAGLIQNIEDNTDNRKLKNSSDKQIFLLPPKNKLNLFIPNRAMNSFSFVFDEKLNSKQRLRVSFSKLPKSLDILKRLKTTDSTNYSQKRSLVQPYINYEIEPLHDTYHSVTTGLHVLQKKAFRAIFNMNLNKNTYEYLK